MDHPNHRRYRQCYYEHVGNIADVSTMCLRHFKLWCIPHRMFADCCAILGAVRLYRRWFLATKHREKNQCMYWKCSRSPYALVKHGGGALVQWLKLPASKVGDRGFESCSCIQVSKKQNVSSSLLVKIQYCGEPPCREVACSASDRQSWNFKLCVSWPSLAYMCTQVA